MPEVPRRSFRRPPRLTHVSGRAVHEVRKLLTTTPRRPIVLPPQAVVRSSPPVGGSHGYRYSAAGRFRRDRGGGGCASTSVGDGRSVHRAAGRAAGWLSHTGLVDRVLDAQR